MRGEVRAVVHVATPGDGRPGHLRAVGRPAPVAGSGEVVVEVHAALLAPGATRPDVDGTIVGAEAAGVVVEVGPSVAGLAVGDAVALPAVRSCGRCPRCRAGRSNLCVEARWPGVDADGWLVERVAVPAHLLVSRPITVPAALAASVPGVVAEAANAVKRAGVGPGITVAVVGAGALGLHLVQLAALAGSDVTVVDDRPDARARAEDLGADDAVALDGASLEGAIAEPVDRVLLTPELPVPVASAVAAAGPGGRVVLVAQAPVDPGPLPADRVVADELDVVGASGATLTDTVELFDLAAEGRLVLATAVTGPRTVDQLEEVETALHAATDGLRIAVDPRPVTAT